MLAGKMKFFTLNRVLLIVIIYGIILRIASFSLGNISGDGASYVTMGAILAKYHSFVLPWNHSFPIYSHSLVYPSYLAVFYSIFGYSIVTTKIASITLSILFLAIIYFLTKDLYDSQKGLIITAIMAIDPTLLYSTWTSYSENMVVLLFALTIWAILKGFKDSRYMIIAGLFAGLMYLNKGELSLNFVMVGLVGFFIWRFYYIKWNLIKDKNYYIGFIIFFFIVVIRYLLAQKSIAISVLTDPNNFLYMFILKFPVIVLLLGVYFFFWIPELKQTLKKVYEEYYSFLWLILIVFILIISLITATWGDLFNRDHQRYVVMLYVPLMWLILGEVNFNFKTTKKGIKEHIRILVDDKKRIQIVLIALSIAILTSFYIGGWLAIYLVFGAISLGMKNPKKKLGMMLIVFLIMGVNFVTANRQLEFKDVAEELNNRILSGETLAADQKYGSTRNMLINLVYPYLTNHNITIIQYYDGCNADYIITEKNINYTRYKLIGIYEYKSTKTLFRRILSSIGVREYVHVKRDSIKLWKKY